MPHLPAPPPLPSGPLLPRLTLPDGPAQPVSGLSAEQLNALTPALARGDFMTAWTYAAQDHAHFLLRREGDALRAYVAAHAQQATLEALLGEVLCELMREPDPDQAAALWGREAGMIEPALLHASLQALLPPPLRTEALCAVTVYLAPPLPGSNDPEGQADVVEYSLEMAYQRAAAALTQAQAEVRARLHTRLREAASSVLN